MYLITSVKYFEPSPASEEYHAHLKSSVIVDQWVIQVVGEDALLKVILDVLVASHCIV